MVPFRRKLGDLLVESGVISKEQLYIAVVEQQKTGEKIGSILCRLNFINKDQLLNLLSQQYKLELICEKKINNARENCINMLSKKTKKWLETNKLNPIDFDAANQTITLAIDDPTNELLLIKIIKYLAPYKTQFKLIKPEASRI